MKHNILLHIGYHKTASTLLQYEVFSNPKLPFNRIDRKCIIDEIIVPSMFSFDSDKVSLNFEERFTENVINVLSEEALVGNPHSGGYTGYTNLLKLKTLFPEAKVLICVREQKSMILSGYKQYLKTVGTLDLERYLDPIKRGAHIMPGFDVQYFCYDRLIAKYQEAFGFNNVKVIPYEKLTINPNEFMSDILAFVGIDRNLIKEIDIKKSVNTAKLNYTLNAKRLWNIHFTRTRVSPHGVLSLPTSINQPFFKFLNGFEMRFLKSRQKQYDKRMLQVIENVVGNSYVISNRITSELIGEDLEQYGYKVNL